MGEILLLIFIIVIVILVAYSRIRRYSYFKSKKYKYILGGIDAFFSEIHSLREEYFTNSAKLGMLSKYEDHRQQLKKYFLYKKAILEK